MRRLVFFLFLLTPAVAVAAPEDAYLAARDAAIVRMTKAADSQSSTETADFEKATGDLEQLLRPLIGPVSVQGFVGDGKLNLGSLAKGDEGYGTLDGLTFAAVNGHGSLVVSTQPLLQRWLVDHKDWWGPGFATMPQSPQAALQTDDFYTQGVNQDAAFFQIAPLAIIAPASAEFVTAMLGARSQDETPEAPGDVVVAMIAGGRVLIAEVPLLQSIPAVPACSQILKSGERKVEAAREAFVRSDRKNTALADKQAKLQAETDAAFHNCYHDKAKASKALIAAEAQAQALANAMAGK